MASMNHSQEMTYAAVLVVRLQMALKQKLDCFLVLF